MIASDQLYQIPDGVQTRWASAENPLAAKGGACLNDDGRKRRPCLTPLRKGETAVLADIKGQSGVIRRIWATSIDSSPAALRGLRLEMTWDGAAKPAVSAPLADFFCHGLSRLSCFDNALFSSPEGRSFLCVIPMPFRSGALITITNETDSDLAMFFYEIDFTVGDQHPPNTAYFHAHWRRENPTRLGEDYTILPKVSGRGRFLGAVIGVVAATNKYFQSWWGEGEVKIYLDGDSAHPTLCGTGTEDYIGTGWGQGKYVNALQGCPIADWERMQFAFYRLHVPDPVWFHQDIRATIQQIGCWNAESIRQLKDSGASLRHGEKTIDMEAATETKFGYFEREDDWSSCAWFYLDKPANDLPPLPPWAERVAGMDTDFKSEHAVA